MAFKYMQCRSSQVVRFFAMAASVGSLAFDANAGDIRDQMEVLTGKAELVIPDMSAQAATTKIKDAISQWAIPANANIRSLPSSIPARPDEPRPVQQYFRGAPVVSYQCGSGYAEITKMPPPVSNAFAFIAEVMQACVYPFQKGVKVYLLHTRVKRMESLTSGLFGGITKAIQGSDDEWMAKQINNNIAEIKKNIPSLLIEKIEIPGAVVQEPDKAAVAALIPAKTEVQAPQITVVSQPAAQIAVAATAPQSSMQAKIEARKNLAAMGLQYHSKEQFIASIRRKDDVAVQLYLDAGAIDLTVRENGKSFVTIAEEASAPEIAKLITDRLVAPTAAPQPGAIPTTVPATSFASTLGEKHAILAKLEATLSPSEKAELDEAISQLPPSMSAEDKAVARLQILSLRAQIKKFTDRIDPETGQLR